jgi:hypothetical protein
VCLIPHDCMIGPAGRRGVTGRCPGCDEVVNERSGMLPGR